MAIGKFIPIVNQPAYHQLKLPLTVYEYPYTISVKSYKNPCYLGKRTGEILPIEEPASGNKNFSIFSLLFICCLNIQRKHTFYF